LPAAVTERPLRRTAAAMLVGEKWAVDSKSRRSRFIIALHQCNSRVHETANRSHWHVALIVKSS
jgi:hypothetical protein